MIKYENDKISRRHNKFRDEYNIHINDNSKKNIFIIQDNYEVASLKEYLSDYNLINPFRNIPKPNLGSTVNNQLPPLPDPTLNTGTQFGNVNTNVNVADQYAALFPADATGKLAAQKRYQTNNRNLL